MAEFYPHHHKFSFVKFSCFPYYSFSLKGSTNCVESPAWSFDLSKHPAWTLVFLKFINFQYNCCSQIRKSHSCKILEFALCTCYFHKIWCTLVLLASKSLLGIENAIWIDVSAIAIQRFSVFLVKLSFVCQWTQSLALHISVGNLWTETPLALNESSIHIVWIIS